MLQRIKHTADLSIISKLECSNRKTASTRIATKAIGAKRPCPKMQLRCQMTSLRHVGEKVPLDEHSSNAGRVRRDTTLRKSGQPAPPKPQKNRKVNERHGQ